MSFDRPLLLLSVLVVPVAGGLYVLAQRRASRYAVRYPNLDVLAAVSDRAGWRRHVPAALVASALTLLAVALAEPHVQRLTAVERAVVVMVVDVSRSMESTDVKPSRLAAARKAAERFLEGVPARLRVGVIAFSGDVTVIGAPTLDHELVRASVHEIGLYSGYGGTAIGDALARAVELGQDAVADEEQPGGPLSPPAADAARGLVSILFLSDGRQNRGILLPAEGARRARVAGIPVYTIALGTRAGGAGAPDRNGGFGTRFRQPDPDTLRAIARTTEGEFFAAPSAEALESAYLELGSRLGRAPRRAEVTFGFVGAAAAIVAAAGLLSVRLGPSLP